MKASDFRQQIGGMADLMKRNTNDTKGCGQLSSNDTLFDDSWFRSMKTAEEENS